MKLGCEAQGDRLIVRIRGDVDGERCDCLAHFWEHYVLPAPARLVVQMRETTSIDSAAVATLVDLLRASRRGGAAVVLESPPQMLAHTLYKVGDLAGIELIDPRQEEPYAG